MKFSRIRIGKSEPGPRNLPIPQEHFIHIICSQKQHVTDLPRTYLKNL
ncbi:Uncharacterized protein dnm_096440 [Desulfonema magnum]|uniref:Uncharacterized protein n=1 Tax=Desulfonema magnum TaxID=45655 RepID=A0A975BXX2_9BACT|nr:Uncharacterized protein dnm_096440 [Desulfonema magnum]